MVRVTLRLFAAAREAVGTAELPLELDGTPTLADALATAAPDARAASVLERCSLLVGGEAEQDRTIALVDGMTIDVLPPFAGG